MLDVSWGEIAVLAGVGLVLIGRKDLPPASRALGTQVGRVVGLLQGARLRADRFATDHQLKQLQNEFRSGLRELDAVKAELAGSMMPHNRGVVGGSMMGGGMGGSENNLGASVSGVDRRKKTMDSMATGGISKSPMTGPSAVTMGAEYLAVAQRAESSQGNSPPISASTDDVVTRLAPRSQSVAAVAEEEWEKRGIGFRSIAEGGTQQRLSMAEDADPKNSAPAPGGVGGAVILSNYMRQSLIYDQYERTVREQDEALRSRVDKVRNERLSGKSDEI
mmetsp:Transcript_10686/g.23176  ORF Transcript_10686/g.23176 Transcript_10686/m.23176 type:complete len:277 (-) Transcript_10686:264-1094(-)